MKTPEQRAAKRRAREFAPRKAKPIVDRDRRPRRELIAPYGLLSTGLKLAVQRALADIRGRK
jgi:hypothetical protein